MQSEKIVTSLRAQGSEIFTALNGLRFLAALAVVFYHYARKMEGFAAYPPVVRSLIECGPAAVGFFFILSGYVLAHRYLQGGSKGQAVGRFYWSRFARLYPAYILAFLLFLPGAIDKYLLHRTAESGGPGILVLSAVLYCLMLQAWTPLAQAWNGPSWSLSVEAFMYLTFPFVGWRLKKLSNASTWLLICVSWLIPVAVTSEYVGGLISKNTWQSYLANNPLLWTPLFVIGILATKFLPAWNRVGQLKASVISIATLVAVVVLAMAWPPARTEIFVSGGIAPLLGAVVVFFSRNPAGIAGIIGGKIFNKLGKASYVLYIVQAPLWHSWQLLIHFLTHAPTDPLLIPAWQFWSFVPLLTLASVFIQHFVEAPLHSWLLKRGGMKEQRRLQRFENSRLGIYRKEENENPVPDADVDAEDDTGARDQKLPA